MALSSTVAAAIISTAILQILSWSHSWTRESETGYLPAKSRGKVLLHNGVRGLSWTRAVVNGILDGIRRYSMQSKPVIRLLPNNHALCYHLR